MGMSSHAWWSQTFTNDGGPLIVLPHELLGYWTGTRSDYDRACDARYPFDFFPVGPGFGVIVSGPDGMVYQANWLRVPGRAGVTLVGWDVGAEDERDWLVGKLSRIAVPWRRHRRRMVIPSGVLFLQHAAGPAAEVQLAAVERTAGIGQAVPVGVGPGKYALETAALDERRGEDRYSCVLCRWLPVEVGPLPDLALRPTAGR
jgi:hypothetical protein